MLAVVPDGPGIAIAVRRPGLVGDAPAARIGRRWCILEDVGHVPRRNRRQEPRRRLRKRTALAAHVVELHRAPAAGETCIERGEVLQPEPDTAKRYGERRLRPRRKLRLEARATQAPIEARRADL